MAQGNLIEIVTALIKAGGMIVAAVLPILLKRRRYRKVNVQDASKAPKDLEE
jgi:hypothetical protein